MQQTTVATQRHASPEPAMLPVQTVTQSTALPAISRSMPTQPSSPEPSLSPSVRTSAPSFSRPLGDVKGTWKIVNLAGVAVYKELPSSHYPSEAEVLSFFKYCTCTCHLLITYTLTSTCATNSTSDMNFLSTEQYSK
jgi:hypothetical protein